MRHFWQEATPQSLVELDVLGTPADRAEGRATILHIADSDADTTSALIANDRASHTSAEACNSVRLARKRVLRAVILGGVDRQPTCNSRADDLLLGAHALGGADLRRVQLEDRVAG
uniref:Uncharacterized protein n=1 Tax=Favella ehrenbergii TaxID=182087 RepID=A0A7S3MM26_9SPIT